MVVRIGGDVVAIPPYSHGCADHVGVVPQHHEQPHLRGRPGAEDVHVGSGYVRGGSEFGDLALSRGQERDVLWVRGWFTAVQVLDAAPRRAPRALAWKTHGACKYRARVRRVKVRRESSQSRRAGLCSRSGRRVGVFKPKAMCNKPISGSVSYAVGARYVRPAASRPGIRLGSPLRARDLIQPVKG